MGIIGEGLKVVVIKKRGKELNGVKGEVVGKEVREMVMGREGGGEGEVVGGWIMEKGKVRK
ncbi:hypothetical protein, partial [Bacillus velezensis]|uniref:hypothetical protein n=1 Tax=Bacillus velezensis TaxID=492670 RepID=UPI0011A08921